MYPRCKRKLLSDKNPIFYAFMRLVGMRHEEDLRRTDYLRALERITNPLAVRRIMWSVCDEVLGPLAKAKAKAKRK